MFFFLVKSVLLTLRHDLVLFYWVLSLNEVDFDDLEVYFIFQCTSFSGVDLLTLRHEFISCSALHLMGSVSLTLRHEFISCSALTSVGSISLTLRHLNPAVDYSLTSRLWACCNCLLIVR